MKKVLEIIWNIFLFLNLILCFFNENTMRINNFVWTNLSIGFFIANILIIASVLVAFNVFNSLPGYKYTVYNSIPMIINYLRGKKPTTPTSGGTNFNLLPIETKYIGPFFLLIFMYHLPYFAYYEEVIFRLGTATWMDVYERSVIFGLIHCLVGIPFAAGFALIIPGFWFSYVYLNGGVYDSTIAHASYNLILFSILLYFSLKKNIKLLIKSNK